MNATWAVGTIVAAGFLVCAACMVLLLQTLRIMKRSEGKDTVELTEHSDMGFFEGLVIQSLRPEWRSYLEGTMIQSNINIAEQRRSQIRRLAYIASGERSSASISYEAIMIFCALLEQDLGVLERRMRESGNQVVAARERATMYLAILGAIAGAFGGIASILGSVH